MTRANYSHSTPWGDDNTSLHQCYSDRIKLPKIHFDEIYIIQRDACCESKESIFPRNMTPTVELVIYVCTYLYV